LLNKGGVQKALKVILTPQHKVLIREKDTVCCGVKSPKQAFGTAPPHGANVTNVNN